jgi:hypothetical protein
MIVLRLRHRPLMTKKMYHGLATFRHSKILAYSGSKSESSRLTPELTGSTT